MKIKKEFNQQIGERIKCARTSAGLTQEQFAELIDKTPQYISDLERGVYGVSLETLKILCERLSISSDSIVFGSIYQNQTDLITQKMERLVPKQFAALTEIIQQFIYAVNLPQDKH